MDKTNNNVIYNFYKIPDEPIMPPTRQCLICEALENPNANYVITYSAWICQECKNRLNQMLYPIENHESKPRTNADKIRAMADEELAEFLGENDSYFPTGDHKKKWLDWLKKEAK